MPNESKKFPSTIYLKEIPPEIFKEILQEQTDIKINRGTTLNHCKTVIKMLRDYSHCRKQNNFKPE